MNQNFIKEKEIQYLDRTGFCEEYITEMNTLVKTVKEMRNMAERLIPYTWPKSDFDVEQDVLCLKQRVITVDGYDINVCFSRADYGDYLLDSLQIQPTDGPFLPFHIVCKVGLVFFGRTLLSYVDFFRGDKKVYCWTIKHNNGSLLHSEQIEIAEFEGFVYEVLDPTSVDLF